MTQLSPAAQAVLNAINKELDEAPWDISFLAGVSAAAAIRAAADQAHPKANIKDIAYTHQNYVDGWKDALDVIFDIATELKAL